MLVPTARQVDEFMRAIPAGTSMDVRTLRRQLALKHGAEVTCPVYTGYHLRTVAEAAHEALERGAPLDEITPFWRVLDEATPTTGRLTFGADFVAEQAPREERAARLRRADRLFQIVQHLRGGRLVTAQKLGQWLEVSERTIYRDIADLQSTGVPIDGEAGVGYLMREGFDLPPLMFTRDEIVALVAGARMVRAFGGAAMARAADEALVKIGAVLPDNERDRIARTEIHTPMWVVTDADRAHIDLLERSVEKRDVLTLDYRDEARPRQRPRRAPARPVVLGQGVDARRLVRAAQRFPRLPHRPHRLGHACRPHLQAGTRQAARRFLPPHGARERAAPGPLVGQ